MLARLQRFILFLASASGLAWLYLHRNDGVHVAMAGILLPAAGYVAVLAVEFVTLRFVNRSDPAPAPSWSELIRAWAAEAAVGVRVFCWRQPFRAHEVPDSIAGPYPPNARGVVFIHGFFCNRGLWTPWLKRLSAAGHPFRAVNLEPVFGSIDDYAPIIEAAVQDVTRVTGKAPILVCHSMGGLAARAWMRASAGRPRVHHVITIGSPHGGTWLGRFSRAKNGSEMRLASSWIEGLAGHEAGEMNAQFTCWYSNCDNIVFPTSTATLPGADNRLIRGAAHVELAFHPEVMDSSLAIIGTL